MGEFLTLSKSDIKAFRNMESKNIYFVDKLIVVYIRTPGMIVKLLLKSVPLLLIKSLLLVLYVDLD